MAWVCDYCGGPPDGWSGGQNEPYRCAQSCRTSSDVVTPGRRIVVVLRVSENIARDAPEATLATLLGMDAAAQVKALIAKEDAA